MFGDDQVISSSEDLKMINSGIFSSMISLILIKHYLFVLSDEGDLYCNKKLSEIENYYSSLIIPLSCVSYTCYILIGLINSNNKVSLCLYGNLANGCESSFYDLLDIEADSDNRL